MVVDFGKVGDAIGGKPVGSYAGKWCFRFCAGIHIIDSVAANSPHEQMSVVRVRDNSCRLDGIPVTVICLNVPSALICTKSPIDWRVMK